MSAPCLRSTALLGGLLGLLILLYAGIFAHRAVLGVDIMEARNLITARNTSRHGFRRTSRNAIRLMKRSSCKFLKI